jgi:hypothetical protein
MAATSTNFGPPVVKQAADIGGLKIRIVSCVGPASYTTNGGEIDLSNDATDGLGNNFDRFTEVYCVNQCAIGAHGNAKYSVRYVPAASGAAATGTLKVLDQSAASDAEVSNATDLSSVTFYFLVIGR